MEENWKDRSNWRKKIIVKWAEEDVETLYKLLNKINNNNNNNLYIELHSHMVVTLQWSSVFTRYHVPRDILIRIFSVFLVSPIHVRLIENCLA